MPRRKKIAAGKWMFFRSSKKKRVTPICYDGPTLHVEVSGQNGQVQQITIIAKDANYRYGINISSRDGTILSQMQPMERPEAGSRPIRPHYARILRQRIDQAVGIGPRKMPEHVRPYWRQAVEVIDSIAQAA